MCTHIHTYFNIPGFIKKYAPISRFSRHPGYSRFSRFSRSVGNHEISNRASWGLEEFIYSYSFFLYIISVSPIVAEIQNQKPQFSYILAVHLIVLIVLLLALYYFLKMFIFLWLYTFIWKPPVVICIPPKPGISLYGDGGITKSVDLAQDEIYGCLTDGGL